MKDKKFVLEWLKRARSHLARAKLGKTSEEVLYEDLCFDCQQVAEKSIKALLISRQREFPWTHSIARLLELVSEEGVEIPDNIKRAIDLTDYAVRTRYPTEIEPVGEEEYEEALTLAENVYNWTTELIYTKEVETMYFSTTKAAEIVEIVCRMERKADDVVLILLGEKDMPDVTRMISGLNKNGINFFGGMFPGVIYDDKKYEQGAVIKVLPALANPYLIRGLDTERIKLPDFALPPDKKYTAMVLVDGLTSNIALFLSRLFDRMGNSVHYFGGGAGSLTLKQQPCLFTSEGFVQDSAVVCFIKLQCNLGVAHGWKKLTGPIVATKTCKNVVMELNWKNAFEVYQKIVEGDCGVKLPQENFYDVAMRYPFGIYKEGAEDIVRDPLMTNEKGELICVGEVPENSLLNILKGEPNSLIQAAGQAAREACSKEICGNLVVDCVSRMLFLGTDFARELSAVKENLCQGISAGMLTLGEISSYGEVFLEFFNKTIVVGGLQEF